MDPRIDLYADQDGLYRATVTLADGSTVDVDPRDVSRHEHEDTESSASHQHWR